MDYHSSAARVRVEIHVATPFFYASDIRSVAEPRPSQSACRATHLLNPRTCRAIIIRLPISREGVAPRGYIGGVVHGAPSFLDKNTFSGTPGHTINFRDNSGMGWQLCISTSACGRMTQQKFSIVFTSDVSACTGYTPRLLTILEEGSQQPRRYPVLPCRLYVIMVILLFLSMHGLLKFLVSKIACNDIQN